MAEGEQSRPREFFYDSTSHQSTPEEGTTTEQEKKEDFIKMVLERIQGIDLQAPDAQAQIMETIKSGRKDRRGPDFPQAVGNALTKANGDRNALATLLVEQMEQHPTEKFWGKGQAEEVEK